MVLYLLKSLNRTMCGGDMSPYLLSGAKPQPPNVFLDIIGAYELGEGKLLLFFLLYVQKVGVQYPTRKSGGMRTPRTSHKLRLWRCRCKIRYVSKFTAVSRGSPCNSTAFLLSFLRVTSKLTCKLTGTVWTLYDKLSEQGRGEGHVRPTF